MLTKEEREALELWSKCDPTSLGGVCNDVDAAVVLSNAMLRLFPVRTYGDLVIRWDDEITHIRLIVCGFVLQGQLINWHYNCPSTTRRVSIHHWNSEHEGAVWEVAGRKLPIYSRPRNMLDVWRLMERCGIDSHAPKETT